MRYQFDYNFLAIVLLFVGFGSNQLTAQNGGNALLAQFGYGSFQPAGDLSDRFGRFDSPTVGLEWINRKNLIIGVRGDFFFGNNVTENTIGDLRNDLGFLYGLGEEPAVVSLKMRGVSGYVYVGKLFPLSKDNARSGIRLTLGGGALQHKIRVQNDPQMPTPQLAGEYVQGYDRLTNGVALTQTLGYQLLSKNRRVNFYVGLEVTEGFTQNRRNANFFQEPIAETGNRSDLMIGLRAAWILPFYLNADGTDQIFY